MTRPANNHYPSPATIRQATLSAELAHRHLVAACLRIEQAYGIDHDQARETRHTITEASQHLEAAVRLLSYRRRAWQWWSIHLAFAAAAVPATGVAARGLPALAAAAIGCGAGTVAALATSRLIHARHEAHLAATASGTPDPPDQQYETVCIGWLKEQVQIAGWHFRIAAEHTDRLVAALPLPPFTAAETRNRRRVNAATIRALLAQHTLHDAKPLIHDRLTHAESL